VSAASGGLVRLPALEGALPAPVAGWRGPDPARPTAVAAPADRRAAVGPLLERRGFALARTLEPGALPERAALPAATRDALRAGPVDLFEPTPAGVCLLAVRELVAAEDPLAAARAALPPALAGLLDRARAEADLVAAGDLLQTWDDGPPPAAAVALARAIGVAADPAGLGDLAALLRGDAGDPGVTPLATALLGAAAWRHVRGALPLDPEVEAWAARAVLAAEGPPLARTTAASVADALPFTPPEPLTAAAVALAAAHDGAEREAPADLPLRPRLLLRARIARGDAAAAEALFELGPERDEALALLLAQAAAGRPPAERRRALRRLAPALDLDVALELLPELAGLDRLVAATAGAADRERALEAARDRLAELAEEDDAFAAAERGAARAAFDALPDRTGLELLDLALAAAEGRSDVVERARAVLAGAAAGPLPREGTLAPAFEVLARAEASPLPVESADPAQLGLLCRFAGFRSRSGGEVDPALLERLVVRDPALGLRLSEVAADVEPAALAQLLGAALPVETALDLVRAGLPGDRLLRVAPRAWPHVWDAVRRGGKVVCHVLGPADGVPFAQAERLVRAEGAVGLELPHAALPPEQVGLGPDTWALVLDRVPGDPVAPAPDLVLTLAGLLGQLHLSGFVLGADPLAAARRLPDGSLGLRGLDPVASLDPEPGQRADVARLAALAGRIVGAAPPEGADLEALAAWYEDQDVKLTPPRDRLPLRLEALGFFEDVLPGRAPVTPAAARDLLPPDLRAAADAAWVRDVLLDLREEGWASGSTRVVVSPDGAFAIADSEVAA